MKKILFVLMLVAGSFTSLYAQSAGKEYKIVTTIESVVPGGLGRSRMIATDKSGNIEETNLENFFSLVGINFGNVKNNDLKITLKIQQMTDEGWTLENTTSGVYSAESSTGIFITRYIFARPKK